MNAETQQPASPSPTDSSSPDKQAASKLIYHPIHPRMRIPYIVGGWIFVGFSILVLVLQIVDPAPAVWGRNLLIFATAVFAGYLLYTAHTEIKQVDSKHAGVQFWISLGAALGFITLSLCVAWVLAKVITS